MNSAEKSKMVLAINKARAIFICCDKISEIGLK